MYPTSYSTWPSCCGVRRIESWRALKSAMTVGRTRVGVGTSLSLWVARSVAPPRSGRPPLLPCRAFGSRRRAHARPGHVPRWTRREGSSARYPRAVSEMAWCGNSSPGSAAHVRDWSCEEPVSAVCGIGRRGRTTPSLWGGGPHGHLWRFRHALSGSPQPCDPPRYAVTGTGVMWIRWKTFPPVPATA